MRDWVTIRVVVTADDRRIGDPLCTHEDFAIWDAAEEADWPWQKEFQGGVLIKLKLTEREDVKQERWCEITQADIEQLEKEYMEDDDEGSMDC